MLQIGDKLPDFRLLGSDEKYYTNFDFADKYALALIFTSNSSPISKAYNNRLIRLFEKYEEDSIGIIGINSNDASQSPEDNFHQMIHTSEHFKLNKIHFLYLQDETQEVAKMFGAQVNPEVFLFNRTIYINKMILSYI